MRDKLEKMLEKESLGNILATLAEIYEESAEQAFDDGDRTSELQFTRVAGSLRIMAIGVDTICPS